MQPATAPTRRGVSDRARTGRWRWLSTDEGWKPSEDGARLLAAVGLALAAVGLKVAVVHGLGGEPGYLSYLGAVAAAAWIAGLRGGVVATAICAIGQVVLFPPAGGVAMSPSVVLNLAMFLFDGILVSILSSLLRRAYVRERDARSEGDAEVEARSALHETAERSRVALGRLQAVTASLAGAATPGDVADAILDRGLTALGAAAGGVSHLTDDGRAVEALAVRGYPGAEPGTRFSLERPSHLRDAIATGEPIFLADRASWTTRYPESPPRPLEGPSHDGAIAVLPLVSAGRTLGAVVFRFAAPRDFADGTGELAIRLAEQGAQALDRALAYDRERRTREALEAGQERLALLARASDLLGARPDAQAGLAAVPDLLVPILADWCVIELLDSDPPALATAATTPGWAESLERLARAAPGYLGRSLIPEAGGGRSTASVIAGGRAERDPDGRSAALLSELGTRSLLACPISAPGSERIGSIVLGASDPDRFGADDLALVQDLARRIATAAERSGLFAAVTRFKATVDESADAVYMFDPRSLGLTYVNRGGADLLGCEPGELIGVSVLELQPTVPETAFRERLAGLQSSSDSSHTYAEILTRRDGGIIPVDVMLQMITLDDGTRTAIMTARDISERIDVQARLARIAGDERRQAAELRAVIQAMGDGVLVVDQDGRITMANEAAGAILGPDLAAGLADLEGRQTRDADATDPGANPAEPPLERDAPRTVRVADGRWLEVATYAADLASGMAEPGHESRIVVVRDVTHARNAEAAREAFLGVLSHELRTPVTTIFGWSKVLQRPSRREDRAEMLRDIQVEADRLYRIVEDLLALTRVEGGITIEGEPLLVQHLAEPIVESEAQRWDRIRFEATLPRDLPAVFGERTYVEQVLRNLVSNAGKYSPPGSSVRVEAEETATEVLVRVLDRGIGIDPDEADRLFDLYYRSPNSARQAGGAGIGLYVGRGLISAMGGRIWARPRPGGGSEFGFSLPRLQDDPPGADEPLGAGEPPGADQPPAP